jgi:hypothetical protein
VPSASPERFRAKWIPVRVKKTRQTKKPELRPALPGTCLERFGVSLWRSGAGGCATRRPWELLMRNLLLILGFVALAIGLLWIGQGTGVIKWPESSFMISQIQWAGYGAALAGLGLVLIWQSKR